MRLHPAAPVLARTDTSLQIGWDQPLVLDDVSAQDARFLRSLEGGRVIGDAERRRHRAVLTSLAGAGLLEDPSAPRTPLGCVRISLAGALGTEIAVALARAGLGVALVDGAPARLAAVPHLPSADCAAVAADRVRAEVPGADLRGAQANAALDVVVSAGPAVLRARRLTARDQAHLLVQVGERAITVGPMVVPGTTACVTCLGLAATAADPAWPTLALQGDARRPRTDPVLATLAGALAAHVVLAHLAGRPTAMWRVDAEGATRLETPPPHPDCRCIEPFPR